MPAAVDVQDPGDEPVWHQVLQIHHEWFNAGLAPPPQTEGKSAPETAGPKLPQVPQVQGMQPSTVMSGLRCEYRNLTICSAC